MNAKETAKEIVRHLKARGIKAKVGLCYRDSGKVFHQITEPIGTLIASVCLLPDGKIGCRHGGHYFEDSSLAKIVETITRKRSCDLSTFGFSHLESRSGGFF